MASTFVAPVPDDLESANLDLRRLKRLRRAPLAEQAADYPHATTTDASEKTFAAIPSQGRPAHRDPSTEENCK